jgi:Holliday junction resolvasome RuvABC endonuclease subunit
MFIDPGSTSAGWALFHDDTLVSSGTVDATGKDQFARLTDIRQGFQYLYASMVRIDEVHIETLNYQTAYACIWSVGVIGQLFQERGATVSQDVYIKSWQKHAGYKKGDGQWKLNACTSEDEWAAICMGRWWLEEGRYNAA